VARRKIGRSFVRHGAWLALVMGFIFIFVRGGRTQDELASPGRARAALQQAIELYKSQEYEKAAPYFAYVKPIQQNLEPADRQDFAKFSPLNALALKGRKDGSTMIRMTEDAVQKGRTKDAGNLLKSLDANQYLNPVERQHVLELHCRLQARARAAPPPHGRTDAKSLLAAGRAAGDLAAEGLANQADQASSLLATWLQPWNDSPAKLRRDIRTVRAKLMEIVPLEVVAKNAEPMPSEPNQSSVTSKVLEIWPFGNVNLKEGGGTDVASVSPANDQRHEPARPQRESDPFYDLQASAIPNFCGGSGPRASAGTLGTPIPRLAWLGAPIPRLAWLGAPIPSMASLAANDSQNKEPPTAIMQDAFALWQR